MRTQIKSESDAAYLLRNQYGHLIRYIPEWEKWIVFDGKIWTRDDALRVDGLIRELLDGHHGIDARWKGSLNVVRNVKGFAVRDTALHVSATEIDADPLLLGIKSGVHSLRRHRPISARRNIYVVKRTSVDPDFARVPKRWIAFVEEICRGDQAKVRYLQRWFGYCLSGSVEERTLLIIYGPGGWSALEKLVQF